MAWRPVRRRAPMAEFAIAQEQEILLALINQKLLVSNREGNEATVEVAHEALFTSWGRLKNWIEVGKQVIFAKNRLADDARRWQRRQHEEASGAEEELLSGTRLAQALDMRARGDFAVVVRGLGEAETQFLDASAALRDRRRQDEQDRQQRELAQAQALATEQKKRADEQAMAAVRQRHLTWVLLAVSLVAVGAALFGWWQWWEARSALREAVAGKLVLKSRAILVGQSDLPIDIGLLLAATAFELKKTNETKSGLQFALNMTTALQKVVSLPESVAAVSADGTTVVTFTQRDDIVSALSMDGEAVLRLRDSSTGQVRGDLITDFKTVPSIAFSPDGKTFVTGQTEDLDHESVRPWDAVTGRPLREPLGLDITVQGHLDGAVFATPKIAFSPDGRTIVSSSADGSLRVWDIISGRMILAPLKGHQHLVTSVSFSADGKTLISGGRDGTLHLWDIASGQPLRTPIQAHAGEVQSVALSRDGKVIASLGTR